MSEYRDEYQRRKRRQKREEESRHREKHAKDASHAKRLSRRSSIAIAGIIAALLIAAPLCFKAIAGEGMKTLDLSMYGHVMMLNARARTLQCPWDKGWLSQASDAYNHELAQTLMVLASSAYDESTCKDNLTNQLQCGKTTSSYQDSIYKDNIDQVAYTFGLDDTNPAQPIVYVAIRGTVNNAEWESNFNLDGYDAELANTHTGFQKATDSVIDALKEFVKDVDLQNAKFVVTGHSRGAAVANLLGAALDNGQISGWQGQSAKENSYVYTFACPNTVASTYAAKGDYGNIFNIANPEDAVTYFPPSSWGFSRYGITKMLPSKSSSADYQTLLAAMQETFSKVTNNQKYHPYATGTQPAFLLSQAFKNAASDAHAYSTEKLGNTKYTMSNTIRALANNCLGESHVLNTNTEKMLTGEAIFYLAQYKPDFLMEILLTIYDEGRTDVNASFSPSFQADGSLPVSTAFIHSHTPETYIAWMLSGNEGLFSDSRRTMTVTGNIDVKIKDAVGNVIASLQNNKIDQGLLESGLPLSVANSMRIVDLPSDGDYTVEYISTVGQLTDLVFTNYGSDGFVKSNALYPDVSLSQNVPYVISVISDPDGTKSAEEELNITKSVAKELGDPLVSDVKNLIDIAVSVGEGHGSVTGGAAILPNEIVTIKAIPDEGASFLGWFEDGNLLSTEPELTFRPERSMSLVAKFGEASSAATSVADTVEQIIADPTNMTQGEVISTISQVGEQIAADAEQFPVPVDLQDLPQAQDVAQGVTQVTQSLPTDTITPEGIHDVVNPIRDDIANRTGTQDLKGTLDQLDDQIKSDANASALDQQVRSEASNLDGQIRSGLQDMQGWLGF